MTDRDYFTDFNVTQTAGEPAAPKSRDYFSEFSGTARPTAASAPQAKEQGWGEWAANLPMRAYKAYQGEQDQKYKDVPAYDQRPAGDGSMRMVGGMLLGSGDAALGDIIQKGLGDKFVRRFKDANGYEIVEHKGDDGNTLQSYVNKPGLDSSDIGRGILGALPYVASGGALGAIGKGAHWFVQSALQGVGAAGTNIGAQLGQKVAGSEQAPIDPVELGISSVAGFAGPAVSAVGGALWRRFVTIPGLVDSSGNLTAKGMAAARAAGIDPADIEGRLAKEFAKDYAKTGDAAAAALKGESKAYGVETTVGQRTKDQQQLLREKNMRFGLEGQTAKDVIANFDQKQADQIERMVRGNGVVRMPPWTKVEPSMLERLAPNKPYISTSQAQLGEDIQKGVRTARGVAKDEASAAWETVPDLVPRKEAFSDLAPMITDSLGKHRLSTATPMAMQMDEALANFASGKVVASGTKLVNQSPIQTVDDMRRHLKGMLFAVDKGNASDAAAAKSIYEGYNAWVQSSAKKSLLNGDVAQAANLTKSVDLSREMHTIFEPKGANFRPNAASRVMKTVLEDPTPERIVSALFSNPTKSEIKDGSVQALRSIKTGLDRYTPATAAETWNSIRVAHWSRLIEGADGKLLSPAVIAKNIDTSIIRHGSFVSELYTHKELKEMMRIARVLKGVSWKDPNPSGTASALGSMVKDFFGTLMRALPTPLKVALEYSKLPQAVGSVSARGAVGQGMSTLHPNWSGQFVGGVNSAYKNR